MNYHKIMELCKDGGIELSTSQKLTILRGIKKFCFNQNFISKEEFVNVYKIMVLGVNIKEEKIREILKTKKDKYLGRDNKRMLNVSVVNKADLKKRLKTEIKLSYSTNPQG